MPTDLDLLLTVRAAHTGGFDTRPIAQLHQLLARGV